ncbi:hypothetical protein [Gordonia aurantiaca]|uniref:hypothetical protein n=1 Tax=Gordonia sp. B21 TaxID=3151852 RepID=UPI0032646C2D
MNDPHLSRRAATSASGAAAGDAASVIGSSNNGSSNTGSRGTGSSNIGASRRGVGPQVIYRYEYRDPYAPMSTRKQILLGTAISLVVIAFMVAALLIGSR